MTRLFWRIAQRWNEARYARAVEAAARFKGRAEKFFQRLHGGGA